MGDYGLGLIQTANINNSSAVFLGGVFRSYATLSSVSSNRESPFSVTGLSLSTSRSAAAASSLFLPAAAHQQNMQDELVAGVKIAQQPPSTEKNNSDSAANKTGQQQPGNSDNRDHNGSPDFSDQLRQNVLDYSQQQLSDFRASVNQDKFGQTQQICDLQQGLNKQQINPQRAEFSSAPPPPPGGELGHLTHKQQYAAVGHQRQGIPESDRSLDSSPVQINPVSVEETEANAVAAASPSQSSVNPNKLKIQMDSPTAHLINNGNGSSSGGGANMLPGGLGAGFTAIQNQEMQNPHQNPSGSASPTLPVFGTPWSVQTSSPPPPVTNSANPNHSNPLNQVHSAEADSGFYPGIPSSVNPAFFQSFSPVSANPCAGVNVHGFGGPFSPQISVPPPQQSRRSPGSPQMHHHHQGAFLQQRNNYNHHQPVMKHSPWSSHQSSGWSSGGVSWGGVHGRDHRRGGGMGVPGPLSQISPMKKPFSSNVIAPPKFPRPANSLGPKSWMEENLFRTDNNSNSLLPLQDRSRMYDSLNMHSLESSLIDIMRAEQDPMKGRMGYPHPGPDSLLMLNARSYGRRRGRSSLFPIDDGLLDDGHGNQGVPGGLQQNGERTERFSRKVFVGGLPPDIDEDEITTSFRRFGHLVVDWPHKAESKSYFPPKGYAFLLFQEESSVQALIEACLEEDGKLYLCVSSPTIKDKPVQIRPWNLSDSDFVMDGSQPLDPRKTIFVGGVPRPLRAVELAMIMDRLYGGVCYAGIDTDPELKYPKGAGRVAFSNQQSYIAAISARFVQLQHGDIDKRVEVKPYVLDDQLCDECQGARCGGKFAPFFCANVTCLQYYCEYCWAAIHSRAGREFHKPLVKEGGDRPRHISFRWN
ncbi:cytoplasmic polyadenylation element-binding protein 2 isoform X1 [Anguilla rostrata]|uniref:cytoplasmic polyadenylation element-binding protein 2 isoform X1 n=1 Tax=Anguilla rostrata TaxID=7938 RepID=UPI0030D324DF